MFRLLFIALFTLLYTSLPTATASPAGPPVAAVQTLSNDTEPQWNIPQITLPTALTTLSGPQQSWVIPESDLVLIITRSKTPLGIRDTLLLLIEVLFSATQRQHDGASDIVEVISHKHGYTQLQVIGMFHKFTTYMAAQVFAGMAREMDKNRYGGFYEASIMVVQHGVGPVARIDIR
ncbi:MAG: hypothetical protein Q9168_007447 [Polycauliona sp. 1 TL-2023]